MFMGKWLRRAENPACISALTARATARASGSSGHIRAAGKRSARYSPIASDSQMTSSPWCSAGTRAEGEWRRMVVRVVASRSCTSTSSKLAPLSFSISQPRSDQEE